MSLPAVHADLIRCHDEQGWLAERRKRIQASDAAKALAEQSQYAVYADKVSPATFNNRTEWQTIKLAMEQPVRKLYQQKFGGKVHELPPHTIAVSRQHSWLGCTPDALVESPDRKGVGNMQIKCWSEFDKASWQDAPPLYVQVQTQIEMFCLGCTWGVVAVMFGSQSLERYFVEPNPKFMEAALAVLHDLWTCIELRTAPPVDGSEATAKALARLHPSDNGLATRLPENLSGIVSRWQRIKSLVKRLEKAGKECENQIKAAIGDNTYGVTENGQWLAWKSQTREAYTVSETTFRTLRTCKEPHRIEYADGSGTTGIDYKVAGRIQLPRWLKVKLLNQRGTCRWCGCKLTMHTATFEHVVALAVGGTNDHSNIDLACAKCNRERGCDAILKVSHAR